MKTLLTLLLVTIPVLSTGYGTDYCFAYDSDNNDYSIDRSVGGVHVTVYHAVPDQCNSDWQHTADMTYLGDDVNNMYRHRIVAVSRDFLNEYGFEMGDTVRVHGLSVPEYNGEWIIHDKMNKRYSKRMDFLVNPGMKAFQRDEKIYIWKK